MSTLTVQELELLKARLAEAEAAGRAEALRSTESFMQWLRVAGIDWIWEKLTKTVSNVFEWLVDQIGDLL
jgi:hypothetical protein